MMAGDRAVILVHEVNLRTNLGILLQIRKKLFGSFTTLGAVSTLSSLLELYLETKINFSCVATVIL